MEKWSVHHTSLVMALHSQMWDVVFHFKIVDSIVVQVRAQETTW